MFGLGGLMGGMGGLGGMMGGGAGMAGGAAGAAGGGFMSTLGSIGRGLGRAADHYVGRDAQQPRPVSGWTDASQPNTLQDEIKKQMQAMKQEQIMRDLMRYQPLEDKGGVSGLTINPYK